MQPQLRVNGSKTTVPVTSSGFVFVNWTMSAFTSTSPTICVQGSNGTDTYSANYVALTVRNTTTTLAKAPVTASTVYGAPLTFTATVTAAGGNPSSVGDVTFKNGATVICNAVPLSGNTATCSPLLNVGAYSMTATYNGAVSGTVQFNASTSTPALAHSITKKALTVTADNDTKTYGAANPAFGFTYSGGFVGTDTAADIDTPPTCTSTATTTTPVGTAPITCSGGLDNNYSLTYVAGTLTIGKKAPTVTADNDTKTYGAANPAFGFTYSGGFVGTDTAADIDTPPTCTSTATTTTPVGTAPITCSGGLDNNYSFTYVAGTLTIGKKALTVTADNDSKPCERPSAPSSARRPVTLTRTRHLTSARGAGRCRQWVARASTTNDQYSMGATVDPKDLTVTANDIADSFAGTESSTTGLVNLDTVDSVTLTSAGAAATAGVAGSPYAIVASDAVGTGLDNYTISYVDGALTVDPKDLTVTADNDSKTYGDTVVFAGTEFSTTGLVNLDTVDSVTLTSAGAAATAGVAGSPYAIVASDAVGTGLDNYTISYVDGALTVDPKDLTVTADNDSKTYGDTVVFAGTEFSTTGLVNLDTVDSVTLTSAGAAATAGVAGSPYAIVASDAVGTGLDNYTISYVDGELTVDPKDLTVTADNDSKTYGDTVVFAGTEFSTTGLVNLDTVDSVTLTSAGAAATAGVAGSPYAIVASDAVGTGPTTTRSATSMAR